MLLSKEIEKRRLLKRKVSEFPRPTRRLRAKRNELSCILEAQNRASTMGTRGGSAVWPRGEQGRENKSTALGTKERALQASSLRERHSSEGRGRGVGQQ